MTRLTGLLRDFDPHGVVNDRIKDAGKWIGILPGSMEPADAWVWRVYAGDHTGAGGGITEAGSVGASPVGYPQQSPTIISHFHSIIMSHSRHERESFVRF